VWAPLTTSLVLGFQLNSGGEITLDQDDFFPVEGGNSQLALMLCHLVHPHVIQKIWSQLKDPIQQLFARPGYLPKHISVKCASILLASIYLGTHPLFPTSWAVRLLNAV